MNSEISTGRRRAGRRQARTAGLRVGTVAVRRERRRPRGLVPSAAVSRATCTQCLDALLAKEGTDWQSLGSAGRDAWASRSAGLCSCGAPVWHECAQRGRYRRRGRGHSSGGARSSRRRPGVHSLSHLEHHALPRREWRPLPGTGGREALRRGPLHGHNRIRNG